MNALFDYILQFGDLNSQQLKLVEGYCEQHRVSKNNFVVEAGDFVNHIYFLTSGIVRICFFNKNGDDVTKYFIDENNFTVDMGSFLFKTQTTTYVQAITDCEFITISKSAYDELSATIPVWDEMFQRITTKGLMAKVDKISPMLAETATERYRRFMIQFPGMVNRIPLSYLASYMGITQSSLSRIRKEIG